MQNFAEFMEVLSTPRDPGLEKYTVQTWFKEKLFQFQSRRNGSEWKEQG